MHKTPIGTRFIVASKNCSNEPLSDIISKFFKMIFNHKIFIKKVYLTYVLKVLDCRKSIPNFYKVDKINTKKKAKNISTFYFTTLYTTISQNLLINVFSEVIHFVFKSKIGRCVGFSKTSIYWTLKGCGRRYIRRKTLIDVISFLILL